MPPHCHLESSFQSVNVHCQRDPRPFRQLPRASGPSCRKPQQKDHPKPDWQAQFPCRRIQLTIGESDHGGSDTSTRVHASPAATRPARHAMPVPLLIQHGRRAHGTGRERTAPAWQRRSSHSARRSPTQDCAAACCTPAPQPAAPQRRRPRRHPSSGNPLPHASVPAAHRAWAWPCLEVLRSAVARCCPAASRQQRRGGTDLSCGLGSDPRPVRHNRLRLL